MTGSTLENCYGLSIEAGKAEFAAATWSAAYEGCPGLVVRVERPEPEPVAADATPIKLRAKAQAGTEPEPADQGDWSAIIRDRVKAEGWSAYSLALASGVDSSVILRFLAGERDVRLATAQKLCAAIGLALMPIES